MHCVMFAVDGQQGLALAASFGGDQLARGNQAFLVGEADSLAGTYSFIGSF